MPIFDEQYSSGQVVFDAQSDPPPPSGAQPILRVEKVIGSLPTTLTANTIYTVRTGAGFSIFVSDTTGMVAHQLNHAMEPTIGSINIANPTPSGRSILAYYDGGAEVISASSVIVGGIDGPSVTYNIAYGPNAALPGTSIWTSDIVVSSVTTGQYTGIVDNATIPSGNWVWVDIKAATGTVPLMHTTIKAIVL